LRANAILKADTKTGLKKGEPVPKDWCPKVMIDGKDVTETTMVGNGSSGKVEFEIQKGGFGVSAKLAKVHVTELKEMPPMEGREEQPRPHSAAPQQPAPAAPVQVEHVGAVDADGFPIL
jgi:hypothetical protein